MTPVHHTAPALLLATLLAACASPATSTHTPRPSATMQSATNTPSPTRLPPTPPPTETQSLAPTPSLDEPFTLPQGGYSFRPILGYDVQPQDETTVAFSDPLGRYIYSFAYTFADPSLPPLEAIEGFLDEIAVRGDGYYHMSDPYDTEVGPVEGTAVDLQGEIFSMPFRGSAVVARPRPERLFFALGIASTSANRHEWRDKGQPAFSAMLSSLEFDGLAPSSAVCDHSTDPTYAFGPSNPIRIGGGPFGGPGREEAYVAALAASDGRPVTFERTGSIPFEDTILDAYEVTYEGALSPLTLYIDEYSYSQPLAPVGLTCRAPFPGPP